MAFNIVKHRDFMLADDVPSWRVAEELRLQNYGHEYIVIIRADIDPGLEPPPSIVPAIDQLRSRASNCDGATTALFGFKGLG